MTGSLYETSMPGYEELKWYLIEVKRGKSAYVERDGRELNTKRKPPVKGGLFRLFC